MKLTGTAILALVALAGGVIIWLRYGDTLKHALNPADPANVVNAGVSKGVQAITGGVAAGGEDTLGGVAARVREFLSGDNAAIQAMKSGSSTNMPAPELTPLDTGFGA
jgi:hypothetical protein